MALVFYPSPFTLLSKHTFFFSCKAFPHYLIWFLQLYMEFSSSNLCFPSTVTLLKSLFTLSPLGGCFFFAVLVSWLTTVQLKIQQMLQASNVVNVGFTLLCFLSLKDLGLSSSNCLGLCSDICKDILKMYFI